jgi:hypothetical protein
MATCGREQDVRFPATAARKENESDRVVQANSPASYGSQALFNCGLLSESRAS